jgi:hypothetical protein
MIISSFHLGLGVCFLHISLGPHINPFFCSLASIESRNFIDLLIEYIFNLKLEIYILWIKKFGWLIQL